MRCTGVILAGGRASRFGGAAKGLERVGGRRIVERAAAALRESTDALLVVANDVDLDGAIPDARVVADVVREAGSLGGIHAALSHAGSAVIVVAWDMPFVPSSLLRALRAVGEVAGVDAVVPEGLGRHGLEPLCAWYAPACLAAITARLDAGERQAISFLSDVRVRRFETDRVREHGDPATIFLNVNTPADLDAAEAHERERARAADAGHRRPEA
jgi:molybdopterin-guanine dinucleotide biosynthesis protein A